MKKIRLLFIEDNRLLRESLTAMLRKQPDLRIMAAAGDFESLVPAAQKLKPHVVLFDLSLRGQDGSSVTESVKKKFPGAKVIVTGLTLALGGGGKRC